MTNKIFVKEADITNFSCDVLILKFAQDFYGVDELISNLLSSNPYEEIAPPIDKYVLLPSQGKIAAKHTLFVGVLPLYQFDYEQIRKFASYSLQILAKQLPDATHIAMTMHGAGYGLDEKESFLAQIAGIFDALGRGNAPLSLKRITIVERDRSRAARLRKILKENLPEEVSAKERKSTRKAALPSKIASAGIKSKNKPHVFVAMPFSEDMEDVYIFGIQGPVNTAGYLCERTDLVAFTGDILDRIKSRIETASLVVADLTGANANVYLEVGYAWGKDRPTLLLARKGEELKFDVQSQRCIIYKNIADLAKKLEENLTALHNEYLAILHTGLY